jgi:ferric-dicitrate binding protein FerR (iron transport regulator)
MEKSYSQIWKYLEGKLSAKEEVELMDWIGESERNADFFNQVIKDYNEINIPSPTQNAHYKWYWAAASIILFLALTIWIFNPFISEAPLQNFKLSDGSELTLSSDSNFEYDSTSFESTKWIKIQGTAEINTKAEEHLLIETQNGYLILEGNSSLQIQELKHNEMKVFVEKGNIRWLNPTVTTEELALVSGEKLLFKKDGKTVISYNNAKVKKAFLIFDNFMNL